MSKELEKRLLESRLMNPDYETRAEAAAELKAGREEIARLEGHYNYYNTKFDEFATRAEQAEAARDKALADVEELRRAGQWAISVVTKHYEQAWGSGLPRDDERFAPYWKALGTLKETKP